MSTRSVRRRTLRTAQIRGPELPDRRLGSRAAVYTGARANKNTAGRDRPIAVPASDALIRVRGGNCASASREATNARTAADSKKIPMLRDAMMANPMSVAAQAASTPARMTPEEAPRRTPGPGRQLRWTPLQSERLPPGDLPLPLATESRCRARPTRLQEDQRLPGRQTLVLNEVREKPPPFTPGRRRLPTSPGYTASLTTTS